MNLKSIAMVGVCSGAVMMSGTASATYLGLGVRLHTTVSVSGAPRSVWRIYAVFSKANDYLSAVAGSDVVGNLQIESRNSTDTGVGSEFFNAGSSNAAPHFNNGVFSPPEAQWDTFPTIGVDANVDSTDQTIIVVGSPAFIPGTTLNSNSIAWFAQLGEQCRAGGPNGLVQSIWFNGPHPLAGANGAYGVLLAQLTVNAGDNVRGTMSISGVNASALAATFIANGQTFSSVPGPGALGLTALIGFVGSRRRRRVG